ncbi:MAG: PAS domain-containing protein, partial [Gammaproteobacteria bacterium]|nr:PAS domain-containing protein [Gammaproteobacteria bacterium]
MTPVDQPPGPADPAQGLITSHLKFPIVGIGASAGGVEALLRLFEQMPASPGMAFVIILHLSPTHESNAAAILQRATSLPVTTVNQPVPVEADHVYVIPPGVELTMNDGYLRTSQRSRVKGAPVTVDTFFRTMAQVHKERAFAIVLSGTGSDGSIGIRAVKEHGGVAIAQAPGDAAHDGMPQAAIATGAVDIVLPAAEMGRQLVALWNNARRIELPDADAAPGAVHAPRDETSAHAAENALHEVMELLRSYTRHDFRHYKRATVLRRIERRLQVNGLPTLPAYRDFLREHPEEAPLLLQDMLISVTNFFRDPAAFDALALSALPALIAAKAPGDPFRVWVAGCATGEEAYSLCMLIREQAARQSKLLNIQIFATDIDERAIGVARKGLYAGGVAEDVGPARMRQFFVHDHEQVRVGTAAREPVLFAVHNLLRDPPFSRLDLISCRNLLIYLDRPAQTHVLEMFRIALKPGGYLFLGSSESTDAISNLFVATDKKHRIFQVNAELRPSRHVPLISDVPVHGPTGARPARDPSTVAGRPSHAELHERALQQFAPPSVLIDADSNVLHLSNGVGRFLERASGEPSHNLLDNVRPDIRLELRTALFKAAQSGRSIETRLTQRQVDGRHVYLNIIVRPLQAEEGRLPTTLVVFDEVEESMPPPDAGPPDSARALLIGQLEEEVRQLKEHLQTTIESSVTSTEELKASNEELQAINEELRSATEELETSKEELQSMNEELVAVNYELKLKVEERGHINDDLENLIASSEIATVFVDQGMRIKRFTPHASQLFNLIASDLGRSLFDITTRLDYPALSEDTAAAFKDLRSSERQVSSIDGRHFLARVVPYRTSDDKIEGAILNFFDITALRTAEERVRAGEGRLKLAAATTRDFAIMVLDEQGLVTAWNAGAHRIFGYTEEEILGRPAAEIFTPEDRAHGVPEQEMSTALRKGRAEDERWHRRKDGSRFYCSGVMMRLEGTEEKGFAKIARDMTGTKQYELAQEHALFKQKRVSMSAQVANELKDKFLAVMSHELKQPLNLIQMNAELLSRMPAAQANPAVLRIGETVKRAVASQSRIIDDLLDLSRIRTGKLRLHRVAVDLCEVLHAVASASTAGAPEKTLELDFHCEPGVACRGDRVRIEQIFWNLLSNAVKFTPSGGTITVSAARDGDEARITIADTGRGIEKEFLSEVFGMFNQVDSSVSPASGGLGIGLALVQELTQAHGGRVQARSAGLDQGTEFIVWLPAGEALTAPEQRPVATTEISLRGWRVLIVDDYADGLL